ncbi:MAG: hypothetical protein M3151_14010, partial [Actinomycetota bacterium]|nr:hypothetical protein [Actinomycetota bacterium]
MWHTGGSVAPPFMDERLAAYGFAKTEELEVLAFELGNGPGPRLPRLGTAAGISAGLARDAGVLREAHRVDSEVFLKPLPSEEEISGYAGEIEELERRQRGEPSGAGSLVLRFVAYMDTEREARDGREIIAAAGAEVVGET